MKAISLWQPWASAVVLKSKRIETRSWSTPYRGWLAIHAAKRMPTASEAALYATPLWQGALHGAALKELPFGAVVGYCKLVDCVPVEKCERMVVKHEATGKREPLLDALRGEAPSQWTERDMGNFTPGRFAWLLTEIKALPPVPYKGQQGLFQVFLGSPMPGTILLDTLKGLR